MGRIKAGKSALPGRHRRRRPRHRHQRPVLRDRLLGSRFARSLRAPHRANRPGRQGGACDLAGVGPRHRKLPATCNKSTASRSPSAEVPTDQAILDRLARSPVGEDRAGGAPAVRNANALGTSTVSSPSWKSLVSSSDEGQARPGRHLRLLPARAPARDHREATSTSSPPPRLPRPRRRGPGASARRSRGRSAPEAAAKAGAEPPCGSRSSAARAPTPIRTLLDLAGSAFPGRRDRVGAGTR